jgi:putative ABC transport system permease protein
MNGVKSWWHRLLALLHRRSHETQMNEEIRQHLDGLIERNVTAGMPAEEARQAALRQFGGVEQVKESARAERIWIWPAEFWQDLQYGFRMLVKNPGFTIVAVLALALGIGANSAIFSVVNTVLLRPLPYKNPDQLMMVWEEAAHFGFPRNTPSPANFLDWRAQNTVFQAMAAMAPSSFNLTGNGEPERFDGRRVSADLFPLLGVEPQLGRVFLPEEDRPGRGRAVIVSYGLWQRRFAADPGIIGKPLTLNGESYTVVGVMPRGFQLPSFKDQLWVPLAFDSKEAASRGNHYLEVIARLKPGSGIKQARAEMDAIALRLQQQYPEDNTRIGVTLVPLHEQIVGDVKPALLLLLGAVGFVLLIACANVANLLLARAAVRQKEIALRLALGAGRSRLTRQFLAESLLLAALGGGFGLLLALLGLDLLKVFIPDTISQAQAISIDARVLIFTVLVSLVTGVIFGLAPATQVSNLNLNVTLKEGGRDSSAGSRGNRMRNVLVVVEVAVSFVLLIGAGLLINSFIHLRNLDPGFRADHLLAMKVQLPELKYPDQAQRSAFYTELTRRVQTLPGVRSTAVASNLPLTYDGDSILISIEGRADPPPDQRRDVVTRVVGPHYFETMGIPLVQGREFTEKDKEASVWGAVISEMTARYFWPGENPIGKRLKPGTSSSTSHWREVIGVVRDVRQNDLVADPKLQMYLTYEQADWFAPNALVVRTSVDPLSLGPAVRRTVWEIDKDQSVSDIRSMAGIVSEALARQRFSMLLLGVFAALALVLAAVGIYGVMSYSVAQRTREIGIRMALGAQKSDVLKMTIRQGLQLVVVGVVIGLAAAFVLTRVMSSLLFRVSATDPTTFVAIPLLLMSVALLASYIPALRSMKIDPVVALRYQ